MKKLVNTAEFVEKGLKRIGFKCIQPLFDYYSGFYKLNYHYSSILDDCEANGTSFWSQAIIQFSATVEFDPKLHNELQSPGAKILVSNHPYGSVDAMVIMEAADQSVAGEWKMVVNKILRNADRLNESIIIVDPFAKGAEKRSNLKSLKQMQLLLKAGGTLVLFPAGRVSGWSDSMQAVCDLDWTDHPLVMALKYDAKLIFAHITGQNSNKFLKIPPKNITKRSIRLAKEVDIQQNRNITINHSISMTPKQLAKIESYSNKSEILKALSYIGADKTEPLKPKEISTSAETEKHSEDFHNKLTDTTPLLCEQSDFSSFIIQGKDNPEIMQEIGRLREQTFQAIGAGSGNTVDLSPEDQYYHHIIVTDRTNGAIIGAYRVGFTQDIIKEQGIDGVYLNHIFNFDDSFFNKLSDSMELSRSFIIPSYQKSPQVLDLLWKSLGKVASQRKINNLFGSVTISADYTPLSQSIIVDTLDRYHSAETDLRDSVSNSSPFTPTTTYHSMLADAFAPHGLNRLNAIIEDIESDYRPIPPLIRYYGSLGAKFLSFKVEPTFNDAIYCLLLLDLSAMPNRYKKRFLES